MYTMRNTMKKISKTKHIIEEVKSLPYFSIDDLIGLEKDKKYLKIFLHRLVNSRKIVSLKKGIYVSKDYLDEIQKRGMFSDYLEFLGTVLYSPSYLSLEYVLSQNNVLTELSWTFTLITKNKTAKFKNELGLFIYHHLKNELFCGFKIIKKANLLVYKASKAKALFDFLYLRKNILVNKKSVEELRLNLESFNRKDIKELEKYVKLENSKKIKEIFNHLFK